MSELVKCPFCDKEIESDSFYCDQCGTELKTCTDGHGFRKGKICGMCGKPLVAAKDATANNEDITVPKTQINDAVNVEPAITSVDTPPVRDKTTNVKPAEPQTMVGITLQARLPMKRGAVIGRKTGDYVSVFGSQGYVSGTHARLQKNSIGSWEIVDLKSSNGTFVNGKKLIPNQPHELQIGDLVAFYDTKFKIE